MTFEIIGAYDKRFEEVDRIAKEFFSIDSDPTQIDANENTFLYSLEIGGITLAASEDNKLLGWSFAFPTNKILMEKFLAGEITEYQ